MRLIVRVAAGKQGVPMMLANLAGPVSLFKHSVDAYKKYYKAYGHDESNMKIGITAYFMFMIPKKLLLKLILFI